VFFWFYRSFWIVVFTGAAVDLRDAANQLCVDGSTE